MSDCYVKNIYLKNFRNFEEKNILLDSYQILITGLNGAGKTSILEAVSSLSAGKGIRGSKFSEQIRTGSEGWALKFEIESYIGNIILVQNHQSSMNKRILELNSRAITATELANFATIFWLTPQLNSLFQESQSDRRKYFDRIVYAFYNEHAANINKYEHYRKERLKILLMEYYDQNWVDIIENKLATLAFEIAKARLEIKENLQKKIDELETSFPKIKIDLDGALETIVDGGDDVISLIKLEYERNRVEDVRAHRNHFGALKTDFSVIHSAKNMPAKFCSTGEQQACLISLMLAQTEYFLQTTSKKPILLLDELFVHLDHRNKAYLTDYIMRQQIQTIVTTTEEELCTEFAINAKIIAL